MRYWKGLLIATVFDAALIAGPEFRETEPPRAHVVEEVAVPVEPELPTLGELNDISVQIDSLMTRLQTTPEDVETLAALARLYTSHEWWEDAIGPLARALALDPDNAELTKQVMVVVKRSGRPAPTAVELRQWAEEFQELVSMWGHSC